MPTTQERRAAARQTDQEIKDNQLAQIAEDRKERDARLGIGSANGAAPVKKTATKKTAAKRTATKKTTAKKATKKTAAKRTAKKA